MRRSNILNSDLFTVADAKLRPVCRVLFILMLIKFSFANVFAYESRTRLSALEKELKQKDIAVISIDVEITQIKSNKSKDANVTWSASARENIIDSLNRLIINSAVTVPLLNKIAAENAEKIEQSIALQSIINLSILGHIQSPLPSKQTFDWSAGDGLRVLKKYGNADYGLFLFVRAGFKTDKSIPEYQAGFISLVNLGNGNTVWFNHHMTISGSFHESGKVDVAMRDLIKGFPGTKETHR